jgi:hypothetical protein
LVGVLGFGGGDNLRGGEFEKIRKRDEEIMRL